MEPHSPPEDLASKTERGLRLIYGSAQVRPAVREGVALVIDAAKAGHPPACRLAAVLLVLGIIDPPDWAAALDMLAHAADLGDDSAQAQLRLLASLAAVSHTGEDWTGLRQKLEIPRWRASPSSAALVQSPLLRTVRSFVPPDVCDWIRSSANALLEPSLVYHPRTAEPIAVDSRSNSAARYRLDQLDLVLLAVRERIGGAIGLPVTFMEPVQVFRYEVGQEFAPHFDFLDASTPGQSDNIQQRGQRLATFLIYLNDDFTDGETEFPELGVRHRGAKGDALFWANLDVRRQVDRRTLHAGRPPGSGEKWVLSQWLRERSLS